ncbi:hypothetical protein DS513_24410 [Salmonella enterica subsp. enterica serovar Sandiego]|nr:hypothetical protein [Salmonella enterica subsp. enterica serovar Sandiego]ECJ5921908.1 hypothetical protein [Salmonella enterica subsp. houtenae]EEM4210508.1 hypothetical protein [Salmonella enterica subsp. houtenae]EHM5263043.1 YfbU family protein [Salmonella enterica]ELE7678341.1 YfbU family protein [Salmonella enterica]
MKYTQPEKLQLLMLCDIFRTLDIKNSFDVDFIEEAVTTDSSWAIDWKYDSIRSGEETPPHVKFVADTLEMFDILKNVYNDLSTSDKTDVSNGVAYFDAATTLTFPGFDGNNEHQYIGVASLLKMMGHFPNQDITKNSHSPKVEIYKRMLSVYLPAYNSWVENEGISKEKLIDILNARFQPSI